MARVLHGSIAVTGLLHDVHAYQTLLARGQRLRIPLDPREAHQLRRLARGLGEGQGTGTRHMPRVLCPLPVTLTLPGRFAQGRLRDVSGGGMRVRTDVPLAPGTDLLVQVAGALEGEEFVFPARVVWCRPGAVAELGLAFEGMPTRTAPTGSPHGRRRRRHTPLVA
jgi:hypothetical protein